LHASTDTATEVDSDRLAFSGRTLWDETTADAERVNLKLLQALTAALERAETPEERREILVELREWRRARR
jgi:hypothetical protein